MSQAPLPIVLVSGFLGSGKTTLLNHFLRNNEGRRIAMIVNEFGAIDIDAGMLRKASTSGDFKSVDFVELENGCICCSLQKELIFAIQEFAASGRIDLVIVESTGVADPFAAACALHLAFGEGSAVEGVARLWALITVVDGYSFLEYLKSEDMMTDDLTMAELLVHQIECANILVLNKVDLLDGDTISRAEEVLRMMNAQASIIPTTQAKIETSKILEEPPVDFEEIHAVATDYQHEHLATEIQVRDCMPGKKVQMVVYRKRRPFFREKFEKVYQSMKGDFLRVKGHLWFALDPNEAWLISQAGAHLTIEPNGSWYAGIYKTWQTAIPEISAMLKPVWLPPWGDRRQEIVFIGFRLDEEAITRQLNTCLISEPDFSEILPQLQRGSK